MSGDLDEALADARPSDPTALPLARARVAEALFGPGTAAGGLGRFHVLERLGAGGMGVVYAAYDPQLDRGVALKVVRVPALGRDAALAEAKVLARLSHPNVVPVYDVGVEGDFVYIVMELVRGETLARWMKGRARGAILDAFRQAGEALAAAHAAGLVHRDFKPDNAIVGSDGRLRVVDFGLACEAATGEPAAGERRPVAGTPGYMAPEQAAGAPVTPAADQYSFCVALGEALAADASQPIPRWLALSIDRGRVADPAARHPSMADLLRALARDPAKIRRRRILLGAAAALVAAVGGAAFVVGRGTLGAADQVCRGADAELAATWATADRAAAIARIAGMGEYGRSLAPQIDQAVREHAARWTAGHRDACLAHRRGAQSAALLDRRMACLERGRAALAAVADIVTQADAAALPSVARAVRAIPDPAACADRDALLAEVEPPPPALAVRVAELDGRLARANVSIIAGRFTEAREIAAPCVDEARTLGYRRLLAEALVVLGHAVMLEDRPAAVPILVEATDVALQARADALAVEAWARRAWAQGTTTDPDGALAGVEVIHALAERTPSARFAHALLYNNIGSVELGRRERRAEARAAFHEALARSKGFTGPAAVELLVVSTNLAVIIDDRAAEDALLVDAIAEMTRMVGADHPETLLIRIIRATSCTSSPAQALEMLTAVCPRYALHPAQVEQAAFCWSELGFLRAELGDYAAAAEAMRRAADVADDLDDPAPEILPYLALWQGDAKGAIAQLETALAARPPQPDEPWWDQFKRGELKLALGRALRAAGEPRRAREMLEASLVDLETVHRSQPKTAAEHRIARARAELAAITKPN